MTSQYEFILNKHLRLKYACTEYLKLLNICAIESDKLHKMLPPPNLSYTDLGEWYRTPENVLRLHNQFQLVHHRYAELRKAFRDYKTCMKELDLNQENEKNDTKKKI